MGEIVNLKRVRKRRAKEAAAQAADIRRAQFGQTKAEKETASIKKRLQEAALDGHRLDIRAGHDPDSDQGGHQ